MSANLRYCHPMNLTFETEREDDVRWLAEVPEIIGVIPYGTTEMDAMAKAESLAFRVLAEQLKHDEFPLQI